MILISDHSEQGSEANNRWWRNFREFHSRQSSIGTSLRDAFVRKSEMADPEILAINAAYVSGEKRRRVRKKVAKIPLPEPVIALLKDDAKEKYLASFNAMEVDEDSSSASARASVPAPPSSIPPQDPPSPTPDQNPQPGPSGTQQPDLASAEIEEEIDFDLDNVEHIQQNFDDLVIINPHSDDDDDEENIPSSGIKRPAEDEDMDTSLGVLALKKKSKSPRKKVEKIRIVNDDSDLEMEEN